MESILLFILGSSGITLIVSISKLFEPVRSWFNDRDHFVKQFIYKVISCPMCLGVYVGAIMFGLQGTLFYDILMHAGACSLVAWVIYINASR